MGFDQSLQYTKVLTNNLCNITSTILNDILHKGMFSLAYFQFSSVQFSSVQFSSVQFSSALGNTFTLTYHYSFQFSSIQFSSIQFSSDQFSSIQLSSVQFSSVQFSSFTPKRTGPKLHCIFPICMRVFFSSSPQDLPLLSLARTQKF